MESSYSSFEDALGYFYDCGVDFTEVILLVDLGRILESNCHSPQDI